MAGGSGSSTSSGREQVLHLHSCPLHQTECSLSPHRRAPPPPHTHTRHMHTHTHTCVRCGAYWSSDSSRLRRRPRSGRSEAGGWAGVGVRGLQARRKKGGRCAFFGGGGRLAHSRLVASMAARAREWAGMPWTTCTCPGCMVLPVIPQSPAVHTYRQAFAPTAYSVRSSAHSPPPLSRAGLTWGGKELCEAGHDAAVELVALQLAADEHERGDGDGRGAAELQRTGQQRQDLPDGHGARDGGDQSRQLAEKGLLRKDGVPGSVGVPRVVAHSHTNHNSRGSMVCACRSCQSRRVRREPAAAARVCAHSPRPPPPLHPTTHAHPHTRVRTPTNKYTSSPTRIWGAPPPTPTHMHTVCTSNTRESRWHSV